MNHQDHWIETLKGRIFLRSWKPENLSNKTPIILFHDSLGCVQLWRNFPTALAEATGREVIAYDRLGFGNSDERTDKPGIDFISKEAEEIFPLIVSELNLDSFIVFGHSVGGAMAVHCAALFPKKCVAVITESTQAFVEDRTRDGISQAKKFFEDPQQFAKLEKHHGSKALWVLKAWIDVWLAEDFSSWSLELTLPKVQCPVLAIHGENDEYGSHKFPEMISSLVSGPFEKLIISECGHVPHKEKEDIVLNTTFNFLERFK